MSTTVKKVDTPADFRAFFEFPWQLYKDDPHWTPTLLSIRRELLDPEKNPSWEYLEGDYYVAWRDEKPVGTIAAFVNHRHNEFHDENIAWFGFFEVEDDTEAAHTLLDTAYQWAKDHGYDALRGPQSFTTHEECGLLVDGFTRPSMLMPYNPPYYQRLVEDYGLHKVMDVYSHYFHYQEDDPDYRATVKRIKKIVDRLKQRINLTIRQIDSKNLKREFDMFKQLYNQVWEENWGFTPMTERELDALIESLSQFFDPRLACFAEVDGEPIGFLLGAPDFNQVLHAAYARPGTPEIWTMLKALWHWKIRPKINWMRLPLMGVKKEYRGQGVDIAMYNYMIDVFNDNQTPYEHLDCGWVLETNHALNGLLEKVHMTVYKTHRFYEITVDPESSVTS